MFTSVIKNIEKPNTLMLLMAFASISALLIISEKPLLEQPLSWDLALLLPMYMLAFVGYIYWCTAIDMLNSFFSKGDMFNAGPTIGCSLLCVCILLTASALANDPTLLSTKLLAQPEFFYLISLYLFSIRTIQIEK